MRKLQCELCMSTDIVKDGGYFICQSCGCKYTVEEARKMMIEGTVEVAGTVDVQGTVQVDNTPYVQRYLANARRAMEKQDWEETEKYYNLVEQNDPDNIEAIFYSAYGKAMTTLVDADIYKRQAAFNVLSRCISVIDDHYKADRWEENKDAIERMALSLSTMINSSFVYNIKRNGYGIEVYNDSNQTRVLFANLVDAFRESINNIEQADDRPYLHTSLITLFEGAKTVGWDNKQKMHALFNAWIAEEQAELTILARETTEIYWMLHPEELKNLNEERNRISSRIEELRSCIAETNEHKKYQRLMQQKIQLTSQMSGLGLFKGREKAALRKQIDDIEVQISRMSGDLEEATSAYRSEIEGLESELAVVQSSLSEVKENISSEQRESLKSELDQRKHRYFESHPGDQTEYEQCTQTMMQAQNERSKAYISLEQAKAALNSAEKKKAIATIELCTERFNAAQSKNSEIVGRILSN